MKFLDQLMLIERMDGLIRRGQTGSPRELADKLGVSESTVYRILRDLRDMGLPIEYNDLKNSYIYTTDITVSVQIVRNEQNKSKGGIHFFCSLSDFDSDGIYFSRCLWP